MKTRFCVKASVLAVLACCAVPAQAVVFPAVAPTPPGATLYVPMTLDFTNSQSVLGGNTLTVGTIGVNAANAVVLERTHGGVTQSMHFVLQGGAVNFITHGYSPLTNSQAMSRWVSSNSMSGCGGGGCGWNGTFQTVDAGLMNPLLAFSSNGMASSSTTTGTLFNSNTTKGSFLSIGSLTPAASIPLTGSAVYTGVLDGRIGGTGNNGKDVAATLTLTANFAARSVAFATTNTFIYDYAAPVGVNPLSVNPNANLTGTLTYQAGSNTFSGNVATPAAGGFTGTAQGRFYGLVAGKPAEIGGVVALSKAATGEKFGGSFGAKTGLPASSVSAGKTVYTPLVANFDVSMAVGGGQTLTTQAVTAATTANSIALYRLPADLGTVGMDYSFTTKAAAGAVPATVVKGQASTSGLTSAAVEASVVGQMNGGVFDGASKWLPTTGSAGFGMMTSGIALQSAAPANTYNYSDFGMWSAPPAGMMGTGAAGLFQAGAGQFLSVGAPTAAATIPKTGTATYAGTVVGYYQGAPTAAVPPATGTTPASLQLLTANVNATANFGTRTMSWSTTGSKLTTPGAVSPIAGVPQGPSTVAAAPTLNMTANLTWAAGANAFSGAVKAQGTGTVAAPALTGTLQGRFYGPVAGAVGATKPLEIGGVFNLKAASGAQMSGAFGAK